MTKLETYQSIASTVATQCALLFKQLESIPPAFRIDVINTLRLELHHYSPFVDEPVDCVLWVPCENVTANDYNPNSVAPPEMELLKLSILNDGYTQPVVAWKLDGDENKHEVVDGFHRTRVGTECPEVRQRVLDHLPLAIVNDRRHDRGDRIAATIRHNRARGKHKIEAMSDIVVELKRRNWSDDKIGRQLGMEPDEVLRLTQITGLAEMFIDKEFSSSWDIDQMDEADVVEDFEVVEA